MISSKLPLLSCLLVAGCITGSAEDRRGLTAAEHEAEARRAEQIAQQHEKRRDPGLYATQRCGNISGSPVPSPPSGVPGQASTGPSITPSLDPCGSSLQFERDHEMEAERLRWMAAKHRGQAARIRSVEAQACSSLTTAEQMAGPVQESEQIVAVRALPDYGRTGKASSQRGGATVLLRQQEGMSAETLAQMINCDVARAAVQGGHELEGSPWAVPGARAVVTETDQGFLVEVTANDRKTAQEIVKRARALDAQAVTK